MEFEVVFENCDSFEGERTDFAGEGTVVGEMNGLMSKEVGVVLEGFFALVTGKGADFLVNGLFVAI